VNDIQAFDQKQQPVSLDQPVTLRFITLNS
jgi:hypothetical protein